MTHIESIAQMPQPGNSTENDYLSVQEIADLCGVTYKMARQYSDRQAVRDWCSAYEHPSSKGVRYPLDSEPKWRALLEAAGKRLVTPANVAAWLQNIEISAPVAQSPTSGNTALVPVPADALAQLPTLGTEAIALLRQLVSTTMISPQQQQAMQQLAAALDRHSDALRSLPAPDDALLTIPQAHATYGLPVPLLRELRVKVGQRYKVKRSAILQEIQKY